MSGSGTFSGTTYQAGVIAQVYVHILAQARLRWFEYFDDTPIGVAGETDGPGDDARIEFGAHHPPVEMQAKHGLTGGAKLTEAINDVVARGGNTGDTKVVFAVDRSSSKPVHRDFRIDLERYRGGRTDELRTETIEIIKGLGTSADVLTRLYVVPLDAEFAADPEVKHALQLLEAVLEDPTQATAAYALLVKDAGELCAKQLRRSRHDLVGLLAGAGIATKTPQPFEREMSQLDISKALLAEGKAQETLGVLAILEANLQEKSADSALWHRLRQHRAAALNLLGRPEEALASVKLALALNERSIPALLTATYACVELGDLTGATAYVDRAIEVDPEHADAWAAKVQVDAMREIDSPAPPAGVVTSESYQYALAQIAMNTGDLDAVVRIAKPLYACGKRDPKVVLLLVTALAALGEKRGGTLHQEAEEIATETIERVADHDSVLTKLLILRAELRRGRGDAEGADADLARAADIEDRDPDALGRLAQAQLHTNRPEYAVRTLSSSLVDDYPLLLVIRAQGHLRLGAREEALRDLDRATGTASDAADPDAVRIYAAETALMLRDADRAEQLLDAVASPDHALEMRAVLRGRIAFERKDAERMEVHYRTALSIAPELQGRLLSELAQRLLRLGKPAEAVRVFEEIGWQDLPQQLHSDYASALVETNALARAAEVVDVLTATAEAPDWALHLASEIASRRGDAMRATELLGRIAARHPDDLRVTFELARRLLAMRQVASALPHLDKLLAGAVALDPAQRMAVAHLLTDAGRREEAIALAFNAFRSAPHDPAMHRGFGGLLMLDPQPVPTPQTVGADTHVKLVSDDGHTRSYVIYAEPPVDPTRHELLLADAEKLGYTGKRIGDVIIEDAGTWSERRWTVEELLPALVYVFRDVMEHFEERFPSEPFFIRMIKLPDESSVKYLAPLLSTLHARRAKAELVFKVYRESTLPLGFIASALGITVADAMEGAMAKEPSLGPLAVEWFDHEGQEETAAAVRAATEVVLTRSALHTLADLDLLEPIRSVFTFVAPRTLAETLQRELLEAEEKVAKGDHSLLATDTGLQPEEHAPGDPSLLARAERIRSLVAWVEANARLELRPLEKLPAAGSPEEQTRAIVGDHSIDAVDLADHLGATLLADDLGLRRLLKGSRARSFSTVALLPYLAERSVITSNERDQKLLSLVGRRYVVTQPSRALLLAALQPGISNALTQEAFALLAGPAIDLATAARIGAHVLRELAIATVQVHPLETAAGLVVTSLARRWPRKLIARVFGRAVEAEFALLPLARKQVRDVIVAFVQPEAIAPDR